MSCVLLLFCATADVAAPPAPTTHGGTPLPRRPVGDVAAALEYTRILDALGGAHATYTFGQHAVILPKEGITANMQDVELGGASNGGFVYQMDWLFGLGHWFGDAGLGLAAGAGFDGITGGRIPFGVRLPIRAWGSANLGPAVRAEASAELAEIVLTPERRSGHEMIGRAGVYIGGRARDPGCFIGVTARRAMDTTLLTFGVGVGLAAAAID